MLDITSDAHGSKSWTISSVLLAFAVTLTLLFQLKKYMYWRSLKAFPSYPSLPIIGTLYMLFGNMKTRVEKGKRMGEMTRNPTIFWFSSVPVITVHTSQHIRQVSANKNGVDRYALGIFKNVLEDGILLATGERWRTTRRVVIRAFSTVMLKQYLTVFNEQADILTKCLAREADTGTTFDLWQYMINMNFDTVVENMLGLKMRVQENGENEFSESIMKVLSLESNRVTNPLLFLQTVYDAYLYVSGNKRWYETVNKLPKKIVAEKLRELRQRQNDDRFAQDEEEKPAKSFIDILLKVHQTNPEFDERRIRVEILNMIFSGSDTSAITGSFTMLFLAMHPEIQDKVYEEIQRVFSDGFAEVQIEHCNQLVYAEQCIKETLRRMSLVPITGRRCPCDIKLDDDLTIPANSNVLLGYYNVHHNPIVYPDPSKFDPDRFSPQNAALNADHFMGFGVGRRSCIGGAYAMLSIKTQMVHVLRNYRLTTDIQMSDIVHIIDLLSRSENGYPVKLWSR